MTASVGVDVGGSFVKAVRRGADGAIEERLRRPTPPSSGAMIDLIADVAGSADPGMPVGVGLAGLVDHDRGVLVWAPHLPGEEVEVGRVLSERLDRSVFVDNDANCAAVAEQRQGAARDATEVLMLTLGTGIGMGLLVDGRIQRGRGHAGEAGHMTVDPGGDACACGRVGCWETKVSGARLAEDAAAVLGPGEGASRLIEAARSGHPAAAEAVGEAANWLAVGIESLVLALDPEVVVVGGAVAGESDDLLLEPVRRRLAGTEGAGHRSPLPLRASILGADSGAIGAAICASEETHP